jgi:UDP-GlcNAc:undecaprenyl-phosphate GlcNAc-1-phosphate transferase
VIRVPYSLMLAVAAMAVAWLTTPLAIRLARRMGALDWPGTRRIHQEAVPRLGGLSMVAAVLSVAWIAYWLPGPAQLLDSSPLLGFTLATVPILILGVVDDVRGTPPWVKLTVQFCSALVLVHFGFGIRVLSNPFGPPIELHQFSIPFTIAWVLTVMNAINVIDGLDGLAAGVVWIASTTLWWVGRTHADFYIMFICALLIGATTGFLRYNFPPARVFMGDTGSQFLGLALAVVSLLDYRKGTVTVTLLFPLVAMALPIADGLFAFARRVVRGQPVFRADTEHVHHQLLRLGLSQREAVLVLWFLCAYLCVMAVVLNALPPSHTLLLAGCLAAGLLFVFQGLAYVNRKLKNSGSDMAPPQD